MHNSQLLYFNSVVIQTKGLARRLVVIPITVRRAGWTYPPLQEAAGLDGCSE